MVPRLILPDEFEKTFEQISFPFYLAKSRDLMLDASLTQRRQKSKSKNDILKFMIPSTLYAVCLNL